MSRHGFSVNTGSYSELEREEEGAISQIGDRPSDRSWWKFVASKLAVSKTKSSRFLDTR